MKKILFFIAFLCSLSFNCLAMESNENLIPNSTSGILMDVESGKIIYSKNIDERVAIASMTKMMAQILILEKIEAGDIKWDDIITVSKNAAGMGGSQIYIAEGEKISIRDLMKGISMASGNDATVAMAEVISGSENKFVKLMNKKASKLGLKNTNFVNSTGLDENNHYSSARDMSIIARELIMKHPTIFKFSSVYEDYLREDTNNKFWLVNTNKLVRFYEGADGLKTGHTDNAGYCLAATAKRNGLRLLAIVLGEKSAKVRNKETMDLLDYGFRNIKYKKLKKKGSFIKKILIDKANYKYINLILKEEAGVVDYNSSLGNKFTYDISLNKIKLPIEKGDVLGYLVIKNDNKKIKRVPLTSDKNIDKLSFSNILFKDFNSLFSGNFAVL